jgi:hypothetical protein
MTERENGTRPKGIKAKAEGQAALQAEIDVAYLTQVFGSQVAAGEAANVSRTTLARVVAGEPVTLTIARRLREAAAEAERTAAALGGTNTPRNGTLDHAAAAAMHIAKAAAECRQAASSAPAISALGFERLADQLEAMRARYLDDLMPAGELKK